MRESDKIFFSGLQFFSQSPDDVVDTCSQLGGNTLIDDYRDCMAIRNYQPATLKKNLLIASKFLAWVENVQTVDTVTVEGYLIHLLRSGRTIKTTKNHLSAIKGFCDFLCNRGIIAENPTHGVKTLDPPRVLPVCLTDDEVDIAYDVAEKHCFLCEVTLAINTGMRLDEMRMLKWVDVDLERRQLIVRKSKSKRPRTIPLNYITRTRLRLQRDRYGHLGYVFPGGRGGYEGLSLWNVDKPRGLNWWQKTSVQLLQEKIKTLQELPRGRTGRGWHALRHTFATRCVKAEIDIIKIKDWMGHQQLDTTMQYIHVARHYDKAIEMI